MRKSSIEDRITKCDKHEFRKKGTAKETRTY